MDTGKKKAGKQYIKEAYRALFDHDFARAVRAFEKAIQHDPTNASYYFKLSVTYARNHQLALAVQTNEKAVALDPENEKYILQHQRLLSRKLTAEALQQFEAGNAEEALPVIEEAMALDPLYVQAHYVAGEIYFSLAQYIKARKAARQAVRLDPGSQEARGLLARCREKAIQEKKEKRE
jgi:Tfp pilus assembly protein PilF